MTTEQNYKFAFGFFLAAQNERLIITFIYRYTLADRRMNKNGNRYRIYPVEKIPVLTMPGRKNTRTTIIVQRNNIDTR